MISDGDLAVLKVGRDSVHDTICSGNAFHWLTVFGKKLFYYKIVLHWKVK